MMTAPAYIVSPTQPNEKPRNSVQINVVVVVDVARALAGGSLEGALMLVDNSLDQHGQPSPGRGTPALQTQCNGGMVINWIAYPVGPFGIPAPLSIAAIRFDEPVCLELAAYGAADVPASPDYVPGITPNYSYWAGIVAPRLAPDRYRYRIEFDLGGIWMGTSAPSLNVWEPPKQVQELQSLRGRMPARIVG